MNFRFDRQMFVALLVLGACLVGPSAALALEAPQTLKPELETITETGATLRGVLSPHAPGEIGATYEFLYNASETGECKGGASTTPGMALGGEAEPVTERIEGLSGQTEYAVCLVERNQAKTQEAVGQVVTFRTGPPETPENLEVVRLTATEATFRATLNPRHAAEPGFYAWSYQSSATECEGPPSLGGESGRLNTQGNQAEVVEFTTTNLKSATTYTFCVTVFTSAFEVAQSVATFTTPTAAAPSITGESTVSTNSSEATVSAEINPGGLASSYSVEYEPVKSTSETVLPASSTAVAVRQRIADLQPGTQYHYRFIVHNELGTTQGLSETFTTGTPAITAGGGSPCPNSTLQGFSPTLPDCRAYELVSGTGEVGEVYDPGGSLDGREQDTTTARPFRAAADGNSVAYLADPGALGGDGSSAKARGNEYLSSRDAVAGSAGWGSTNITPPETVRESPSRERAYEAFSPDLSVGIVNSEQPLLGVGSSPQGPAGCQILYTRAAGQAPGTFGSLFTETLSPGFCGQHDGKAGLDDSLIFAGETPNHAIRVFDSTAALVAPAVTSGEGNGANVYASASNGALAAVNVLPNGSIESQAVAGGPSEMPNNAPNLNGVVSHEGSRIIWSSVAAKESLNGSMAAFPTALYVREDPLSSTARTVQLDAAIGGAPGPSGDGQFWASAANGDKVFFTDCHKLTPDSTADEAGGCTHRESNDNYVVQTGADLYEYDLSSGLAPRLIDLTVDHAGSDLLGADVQAVVGTSDDGNFVYFVAGGALGAKPNTRGEVPQAGVCEKSNQGTEQEQELEGHVPAAFGCNLFELHFNGSEWEAPKFIARLAALDDTAGPNLNNPDSSGRGGDWNPTLGSRTAEVTSNGEALVFSSTQDLTGYDVASAGLARATGELGGSEIFIFKASGNSLTCVSCDPRNKPLDLQLIKKVPDVYLPVSSSGTFMHRWVNAQGTEVFFDSEQALVPSDNNAVQDVYEWEVEGGSSCPRSTSVYGGCIFLLSGGESSDYSFLADADESGENVFIVHRGALGDAAPRDDKAHLYDVRVGGGFAASELGCVGTGCQGVPPAAPIFATPASATFDGVGNFAAGKGAVPTKARKRSQKPSRSLKACRKQRLKRRRIACERDFRSRRAGASSRVGHRSNERGRTA